MICGTGPTAVLHVLTERYRTVRYGIRGMQTDSLQCMEYMMPKHDRLRPKQAQVWKRAALRGRGFRPLFRSLSLSSLSLSILSLCNEEEHAMGISPRTRRVRDEFAENHHSKHTTEQGKRKREREWCTCSVLRRWQQRQVLNASFRS